MKNVDLTVKVTGKSEVTRRYSRYDGSPLQFCLATVSDASGSIRLPLWNDQIDSVSVGDEIELKKAYVKAFQGVLQIVPNRRKGELNITKPMKQVIQSR
jgi:ssDNA-binding replication factor A large subunit